MAAMEVTGGGNGKGATDGGSQLPAPAQQERVLARPSGVRAPDTRPVLITFPPSLDCELSRFLLVHYGIDYEERRHTLIFSSIATLWHARTVLFPLLYSSQFRFSRVREIADHFDPLASPNRRLLPSGDRSQAEADWDLFNAKLGYATARFAYYHLLSRREIMIRPLSEGTPAYEVWAVTHAFPLFAGLLRLLLGLNESRAQEALDTIRRIVASVDTRLADGRPYLAGNTFTLSDMAFAVAIAPVILPAAYGGPLPSLTEMPPAMQAAIQEVRGHPAAQFALDIYVRHRLRPIAPQKGETEITTAI